jgi:hypothetical protein
VKLDLRKLRRTSTIAVSAAALAAMPLLAGTTASATPAPTSVVVAAEPGDGTIDGAIAWMESKSGSSDWEGLCEMAVENAYGTTGVWPSAIAHWQGALDNGKGHPDDTNPPKGAFVYWNTSQYGHVGIADGNGGFYSSSVNGAIGHGDSLDHFVNYLGWSDAQVPG